MTEEGTSGPRTDPSFFEAMYASADHHDPWRFATEHYEQDRYRTLIDRLPARRFARCLEPGCSIGELSALLANHSDRVTAFDVSPTAIRTARARHGGESIDFHLAAFPDDLDRFPGSFDLVCLSEICYYLTTERLTVATAAVATRVVPGGLVLAGHWSGHSRDHVLTGVQAHDVLDDVLTDHGFRSTAARQHHPGFVVDLWRRPPDRGSSLVDLVT
jgi:2-polyprenyl-3-methyl-5-hydroxy-6-metoxy-1,4-benzoquinol methylase